MIKQRISTGLETLSLCVMGAAFCSGLALLGWQGVMWIDRGEWIEWSAIDVLFWLYHAEWFWAPNRLLGLHKILSSINGGLFVFLVGMGVGLVVAALSEDFK
jgi:hypothetical protein